MAKTRLTIEIDEKLATAVRSTAAGTGEQDATVIERALASYFGLRSTVNRIHAQLGDDAIEDEDEADAFAVAEVKAYRADKANRR